MSDERQKLIELVQDMDSNRVKILLDYAYYLVNISNYKNNSQERRGNEKNVDNINQTKPQTYNSTSLQFLGVTNKNIDLEIVEHEEYLLKSDSDNWYKICALIKNTSSDTVSLNISVNYYDEDDVIVSNDYLVGPKIKPGKSWKIIEQPHLDKAIIKYDFDVEVYCQ
jgi:CRISPR/Cas system-associated protein endoribonuclease Cas2